MPNSEINENHVSLLKCTSDPIVTSHPISSFNETVKECDGNIECKYATYDANPSQKIATLYDYKCINDDLDFNAYSESDKKYTYNKDYANLSDPVWLTTKINSLIEGHDIDDIKCPTEIPGLDMLLKSIDFDVLLNSKDFPKEGGDPGTNYDANSVIRLNKIIKDMDDNPSKYQDVDPGIVKIIKNCFTDRTTYGTHNTTDGKFNIIKGTDPTDICYNFNSEDQRNHFMTYIGDNIESSDCHTRITLNATEKKMYDMAKNIVDKVWERINDYLTDSGDPHNIIPSDPDAKKMWIQQHFHHGVHNKTISFLDNKVNGNIDKQSEDPKNNKGFYLHDSNSDFWRGPLFDTDPVTDESGVSDDEKQSAFALFRGTTNSEGVKFLKCNEPDMVNKTPHAFNILKVATMLISWSAVSKRLGARCAFGTLKKHYKATDDEKENFTSRKNIPTGLLLDINYGIQTGLNRSGKQIDRNKLLRVVSYYGTNNINNGDILEVLSGL